MGLFYQRKKDTQEDNNTADPWRLFGVTQGEDAKADSEKVSYEVRKTSDDLPTGVVPDDSSSDSDGAALEADGAESENSSHV